MKLVDALLVALRLDRTVEQPLDDEVAQAAIVGDKPGKPARIGSAVACEGKLHEVLLLGLRQCAKLGLAVQGVGDARRRRVAGYGGPATNLFLPPLQAQR